MNLKHHNFPNTWISFTADSKSTFAAGISEYFLLDTQYFNHFINPSPSLEPSRPLSDKVVEALHRVTHVEGLNPGIAPATENVAEAAKSWLQWAKANYLEEPQIVLPGDGGLILEWTRDNNLVSIRFDPEDREFDSIFSRIDGIRQTVEFSQETLKTLLDDFAITATTKPHITPEIAVRISTKARESFGPYGAGFDTDTSTSFGTPCPA